MTPREEFSVLYDSLDALDERAAEQPERIGIQRHLSTLRARIQEVVQKLYLARAHIADLEAAHPVAADADTADKVTRMRRALYQIAHWPDGGNAYGQAKIKRFAIGILDGDPPTVPADAVAPMLTDEQRDAIECGMLRIPTVAVDAAAQRLETTSEHIARDMQEGRFPERSEPQMVPAQPDQFAQSRNMVPQPDERAAFEQLNGEWQSMTPFDVFRAGWQARATAAQATTATSGRISLPALVDASEAAWAAKARTDRGGSDAD